MKDETLKDCPLCDTKNTVFEGETIKRCLRCMEDIPQQDDFSE